jgi:hypothetical protein
MPKSVLITLQVAVGIPDGAEICDGYIHLPSGEEMLPVLAFEEEDKLLADDSDIMATIGSMEYVSCTISHITEEN